MFYKTGTAKVTPEIYVLSGPNGAGKSTTAAVLLPEHLGVNRFVNADLIAEDLSPSAPEKSAIQAGRLMLRRIRELRQRRESFAFETTLATRSYVRFLQGSQAAGYVVHLIYVWLSNVQLARARVAVRVQQGGHNISDEVVERRYWRGLCNLFALYRPFVDTWALCDNSSNELAVVAHGDLTGDEIVLAPSIYDRIKSYDRHESS